MNFDDKIRPALMKKHPEMQEEDIEVFRRKWEVRTTPVPIKDRTLTVAVLLCVLRGGLHDQDARRCHHHCRERGRHGADGGNSSVT